MGRTVYLPTNLPYNSTIQVGTGQGDNPKDTFRPMDGMGLQLYNNRPV